MKKTTFYLIALLALMITSIGAMAQPGGLNPLVGSTHKYSVTPGGANTLAWTVSGSAYSISGEATQTATITWTAVGTYTLTFTETNLTTGCKTIKESTIVVGANTFDVSTSAPLSNCNTATGVPNYSGTTATTPVTFVINMTTSSTWSPNWEFTFTLAPSSGSIANVKAGSTSLTAVSGTYKATGLTSAPGTGNGTVNITMDFTGNITSTNTIDMAITSAKELQYNTPDRDNTDWTTSQTINAIPNTTAITTD